ncbi:MAG: (2Fe-2S)-binding protein [Gammaproteobacteria bacterium]|nr:(2Fe-2S)-binding protein [Gammaproteobacteria bacterium]
MTSTLPRNVRLITGLIIFAFVISHLLNLSVGLVSVEAMDRFLPVFMAPWYNPVGAVLLYGSLLVHMLFALHALYMRRTLRMTRFDAVQLGIALALPPLLVAHILATRAANMQFGFEPTYAWMLVFFWKLAPLAGLRQLLVLIIAWVHGCMGLYYWFRLQKWWPRWEHFIYPLAFAVPVLALLGFVEGGKDALQAAASSPGWLDAVQAKLPPQEDYLALVARQQWFIAAYVGMIAITLVLRAWRCRNKTAETVEIRYVDGPVINIAEGLSILEGARLQEVPHASQCGGRGRCTTCRVRIIGGQENLANPTPLELHGLQRINAPADVRLACQTLPSGPVIVERLVPTDRPYDASRVEETMRRDGVLVLFQFAQPKALSVQALVDALEARHAPIVQLTHKSVIAIFGGNESIAQTMQEVMTFIDHAFAASDRKLSALVHVGHFTVEPIRLAGVEQPTVAGEPIDALLAWRSLLDSATDTLLVSQRAAAAAGDSFVLDGAVDTTSSIEPGRWILRAAPAQEVA